MTNLQELRETLHGHAEQIEDLGGAARVGTVHDRVRGVRRQRRAVVGGVAVAAVAAAAIGVGLPSGEQPAPVRPGGLAAPEKIEANGYTYDLTDTVTGGGQVTTKVNATQAPVLVAWGTERGVDDPVRVKAFGAPAYTSADPAFEDFMVVLPGESGTVRVSEAEGDVVVSTYSLSDAAPAGVTEDGITYRSRIGSQELVAAVVGEPGEAELGLDLEAPRGPVQISRLCAGVGEDYAVNISLGEGGMVQNGLCGGDTFDPGADMTLELDELAAPGTDVTVRVWLSRRGGDTPLDASEVPADVRLGVGVYADVPELQVDGQPRRIEADGHTWELVLENSASGGMPVTVPVAPGTRHRAAVFYRGSQMVQFGYSARVAGAEQDLGRSANYGPAEGGLGLVDVPLGAEELTVDVVRGETPDLKTTVVLYQRLD